MLDGLVSAGLAPDWLSLLVGYGLGVGGLLGATLYGHLRARAARKRARQADAAVDPRAPLGEGFTAVAGAVEYAADVDHAVRVEIEQDGTEHESSGSWTTRWTEANRTIDVSPFYIRRPSGERVRVEPTREVYLVDPLDRVIRVNLAKRIRVAELVPGEHVIAIGALSREADPEAAEEGGGYRQGERRGWVLRAPARERLLLSTEKVGARFLRRAGLHRAASLVTLVVFVAVHAGLLAFHARALAGRDLEGIVERSWVSTSTDDDGDTTTSLHVLVAADGASFEDEVDDVLPHAGQRLAVRWVRAWPWASAVGASARMHWGFIVLIPILVALGAALHALAGSTTIGWYDSGSVVDSAPGRLAEDDSGRSR